MNTTLPGQEAMMKNTNKKQLLHLLCTCDCPADKILFVNHTECIVKHEETDVTLISYMLQEAQAEVPTIRILSDDTDIFVLLVYWAWKANVKSAVQMKWDDIILDINATVRTLSDKCQGLLGMHALSGCDTVSYPCGKGKVSALKVLQESTMPGLYTVLGEPDATHRDLKRYRDQVHPRTVWAKRGQVHEQFLLLNLKIFLQLMPHILRAHLQVMLWKAAHQSEPPAEARDITKFGWELAKGGVVRPAVATHLLDICSCSALKACSQRNCSCHAASLSCIYKCEGPLLQLIHNTAKNMRRVKETRREMMERVKVIECKVVVLS